MVLLSAPGALGFLAPQPPATRSQQQEQISSSCRAGPLASSYYDNYDAQGARNMEQDRCVCGCVKVCACKTMLAGVVIFDRWTSRSMAAR